MDVMVAPVSGGRFPQQLAAIQVLCDLGYKPRLALCSSGGNIATFLTASGRWNSLGIERVMKSVSDIHVVSSWFPSMLQWVPSYMAGLFLGSIYKSSQQTINVFREYLTPQDIVDTEIWVGTINADTSAVGLFCNCSKDEAVIQGKHFSGGMFKCEDLKYLSGDVEAICKASMASSTIPTILQPQKIGNSYYIDGGTKFASPAALLSDELRALSYTHGGIHVMYINGYDVEEDMIEDKLKNLITQGINTTEHAVRGFLLHDRMSLYNLVCNPRCSKIGVCHKSRLYHATFPIAKLPEVYAVHRQSISSLIEIYPGSKVTLLDYTNFKGTDAVKIMDESRDKLACRIWWHGNENLLSGIVDGVTEMKSVN